MTRPPKRWILEPKAPANHLLRLSHLPKLIVQVLWNRGIHDPVEVEAFLNGEIRLDDPFRIKGMTQAVERIRRAVERGERIAVYGDFDADGVTATALMVQTLSALGAHVHPYIPRRVDEGYGLNVNALAELERQGTRLVITVDCGIRSLDEVAFANRLGLDVIVTDHHSVGPQLPAALAAINPKRSDCPYPFKGLAGVGLAFKLAQGLLRVQRQTPVGYKPLTLQEQDLLDLVALGTVADLAPLLHENRSLVQRGLEQLNRTERPGLHAMLALAGVAPQQITATTIGFALGPRLNAAGRLADAMLSYDLLTTDDVFTAQQTARQLNELNVQRQQKTADAFALAESEIASTDEQQFLHMIANEAFEPGIVGLVAGRLTEQHYRPALVLQIGPQHSRGSARSIAEFDITAALDRCAEQGLLLRHGGHAAAAGLTVETRKLPALTARLRELAMEQLSGKDLRPPLVIDQEIPLREVDHALNGWLKKLEPTGYANPQPRLLSRWVKVLTTRAVGAEGAHLKLTLSDPMAGPNQQKTYDAIAFRKGDWHGRLPNEIDVVYMVEENVWNGATRLQLVVEDVRAAGRTVFSQ